LLVARVLERLSPSARLIITLLEIEDRSVKEIAALTGCRALVKVRAIPGTGGNEKNSGQTAETQVFVTLHYRVASDEIKHV